MVHTQARGVLCSWPKDRLRQGSVQVARNLIVNADDLGWTSGVNRGIAEAIATGL